MMIMASSIIIIITTTITMAMITTIKFKTYKCHRHCIGESLVFQSVVVSSMM